MTLPRFLVSIVTAAVLVASSAPAEADNVKFPAASAEAIDAGVEGGIAPDSLGGGKAPEVALAGTIEVKDPTEDPGGFISDVRAAAKKGWPVMALMLMVGAAIVARKYVAALRKPGTRTAAVAASVVTVGTAVIALLSGVANLTEVLTAVAIAIGMVWAPQAPDLDGDGKPDA